MRSEVLTLDLARQLARIRPLRPQGALAQAPGKTLDRLLDALEAYSGGALPEAFLDAQDAQEAGLGAATDGLLEFLAALANQWRAADETFWLGHTTQAEAAALERDVDAALLVLPDRRTASAFELDLAALETSIAALDRARANVRDPPAHAIAPDQAEASAAVHKQLDTAVSETRRSLKRVERAVKLYSDAAVALERSRDARQRMQNAVEAWRELEAVVMTTLPALRPNLADERALAEPSDAAVYGAAAADLETRLNGQIAAVASLDAEVGEIVAELERTGVDPNVRREMGEALAGLLDARRRIVAAIEVERADAGLLALARTAWSALEAAIERSSRIIDELSRDIVASAWRPDRAPTDTQAVLDASFALDGVQSACDAAMAQLDPARHEHTRAQLELGLSRARSQAASIEPLVRLRDEVHQQARAVSSLRSELGAAHDQLDAIAQQLASDASADVDASVALTRAADLLRDVHSRTGPQLDDWVGHAGQAAPLDLPAQDSLVRDFVNELCARLGGAVDGVHAAQRATGLRRRATALGGQLDVIGADLERSRESFRPTMEAAKLLLAETRCARASRGIADWRSAALDQASARDGADAELPTTR